jgi:hypothetical protein
MALTGMEQVGLVMHLGDVAAGSALNIPVLKPNRQIEITGAKVAARSAVAADASNYISFALMRAAGATICSVNTSSAGLTAAEFRSFSTPAAAYKQVGTSHNMYLAITHGGSGKAANGLTLLVNYEIIS